MDGATPAASSKIGNSFNWIFMSSAPVLFKKLNTTYDIYAVPACTPCRDLTVISLRLSTIDRCNKIEQILRRLRHRHIDQFAVNRRARRAARERLSYAATHGSGIELFCGGLDFVGGFDLRGWITGATTPAQ